MCARNLLEASSARTLRFPHAKDDLRRITVRDQSGQYEVYRLAPIVADWPAAELPDDVNPRSHDDQCLRSAVAKAIEYTLRHSPEDFWLANRGGYVLAEQVKFHPALSQVEISITDTELHGIADGATSNAVIKKLQAELRQTKDPELAAALAAARFNVDVVVGLTDPDRIAKLVQGRNRSVQVKEWSLADFKGEFDWIKDLIDRADGPFKGRIGWEENAVSEVSVLDLVSLMTLFHPVYDDPSERRRKAPTAAFSSKGTNDKRLTDEKMEDGFKQLKPVLEDIIRLHDYVYANFELTYERYNSEVNNRASKLGRRRGVENKKFQLPLTDTETEYRIDKGLLFPLLASFRSLLKFGGRGTTWKTDPKEFFDECGSDLMAALIEQYELCDKNPATTGKTKAVYTALHNQARLLLSDRVGT